MALLVIWRRETYVTIHDVTPAEPHRTRIVEAIRRMGTARIPEIAEAAGMSNGAAFRYCYGMYEKGILSRIVEGNGRVRYFVREEGVAPGSGE
jgi:hypothetical protein